MIPNHARRSRSAILALAVVYFVVAPASLWAQKPQPFDLSTLRKGAPAFPLFWKPYRPLSLSRLDFRNGPRLERRLLDGKLALSVREFLQLVIENNLDLSAARFDYVIAQVDILRAQSGQAARGTSSSPLPAAIFAGALGAGVSSTAAVSPGGTGGAAITTQGKLITIGPRGNFDPTLSINLSYDHLVNPLNTRKVAGTDEVIIPSTVLQTRFQQELPYGTSYSVSFNMQRQGSTQAGLVFNPALTSFFAFQVYQPLLNGFGLALTRRFVTLAENDRSIVREAYHAMLNDTLSNAANVYWDLVALRESVRVAEQAVLAADRQLDEDRQRVDVGAMTGIDVLSAQSQLASARAQLVMAQTRVQQQEIVLKALITNTDSARLQAITIEPTDPLPDGPDIEIPPLRGSIGAALSNRSSIRQAQLSLQNEHIAEEYTRKNLLPTFSIYASLNLYGLAPGTNLAVRQLVQWAYPEYSVGFTWSLPLFNRAAQADDVRARLEAQQAEAALQRNKNQITVQVETATVSLTQGRAQVEAAQRAAVASLRAFQGEQDKQRAGLSTAYRVLLAQRDLTSAQSAEIQARVNYAKARVSHEVAVGAFLEDNGIVASDALNGNVWKDREKE